MLLAAPFVIAGLALNLAHPTWFAVGGPLTLLQVLSLAALVAGLVIWAWSVVLILRKVLAAG